MVSTLSLKQFDQQTKDLEKEGLIELARKSLLTLNERCRQVVELRDFQGVSYAQIAQKLEIQMGTVMSRLARCREALKNIVLYELKGHS